MDLGRENANKSKQIANDLNLEAIDNDNCNSPDNSVLCSICLEPLGNKVDNCRTHVKLQCSHEFHLDCIGSAFNAKGLMQCPYCRKVEQGQWLHATGPPIPNLGAEDSIAEEEAVLRLSSLVSYGSELCPFEGLGHLSLFWGPNIWSQDIHFHVAAGPQGGQLCPYIDYPLTNSESSAVAAAVGVTENSNLNTNLGEVPNSDGLPNPPRLIPLSPLPSNPRYFWNGSDREAIISRHYYAHPLLDHSSIGRSNNLNTNAPRVSPYPGESSVANPNGISVATSATVAPPHQGVNAQMVPPDLSNTTLMPLDWFRSFMDDIATPVSRGSVFSSGRRQVARGVSESWSTSTSLNHVGDNGFDQFNVGPGFVLELTELHPVERELVRAAAALVEEEFPTIRHMMYNGGGIDNRGGSNNGINRSGAGSDGNSGGDRSGESDGDGERNSGNGGDISG